jgi:hypothetical protein
MKEWLRLPGLFQRWELDQVIGPGEDIRIEEAGSACDGTPLFAVYFKQLENKETNNERRMETSRGNR